MRYKTYKSTYNTNKTGLRTEHNKAKKKNYGFSMTTLKTVVTKYTNTKTGVPQIILAMSISRGQDILVHHLNKGPQSLGSVCRYLSTTVEGFTSHLA